MAAVQHLQLLPGAEGQSGGVDPRQQDLLGPGEVQELADIHPHILPDDPQQILKGPIVRTIPLQGPVKHRQRELQQTASAGVQAGAGQLQDLTAVGLQNIPEQVRLVGEVLVKAAPGDLRRLDDAVDGHLAIGPAGELRHSGPEELLPLGGREVEKRGGGHTAPPL